MVATETGESVWSAIRMEDDTGTGLEGVAASGGERSCHCEGGQCPLQLLSSSENTATVVEPHTLVPGMLHSEDNESYSRPLL